MGTIISVLHSKPKYLDVTAYGASDAAFRRRLQEPVGVNCLLPPPSAHRCSTAGLRARFESRSPARPSARSLPLPTLRIHLSLRRSFDVIVLCCSELHDFCRLPSFQLAHLRMPSLFGLTAYYTPKLKIAFARVLPSGDQTGNCANSFIDKRLDGGVSILEATSTAEPSLLLLCKIQSMGKSCACG
eukprot:6183787-Pleurochrysis_carterae.AAC.3